MMNQGMVAPGTAANQAPYMARYAATRIDFDLPEVPVETVVNRANGSLTAAAPPGTGNLSVRVENGVAILSGQAESAEAARRAAALLSLEPGIRSVRNEVTISNPDTE